MTKTNVALVSPASVPASAMLDRFENTADIDPAAAGFIVDFAAAAAPKTEFARGLIARLDAVQAEVAAAKKDGKKTRGLADLGQRGNVVSVSPMLLQVKEADSSRDWEDPTVQRGVIELAHDIARNALLTPLSVYFDADARTYYVSKGQRRLRAVLYAINQLGAEIATVMVMPEPQSTTYAERLLNRLSRDQVATLTDYDRAHIFVKLVRNGWSPESIAQRVGCNALTVKNLLAFHNAMSNAPALRALITAGTTTRSVVMQALNHSEGSAVGAQALLDAALVLAQSQGKTSIKPRYLDWAAAQQQAAQTTLRLVPAAEPSEGETGAEAADDARGEREKKAEVVTAAPLAAPATKAALRAQVADLETKLRAEQKKPGRDALRAIRAIIAPATAEAKEIGDGLKMLTLTEADYNALLRALDI